ncbi:MAG: hypothetical protein NC920_02370 [Candidatus Omnitrophica bacterium]|nr:hypothetical protein [Candidatus Omnitrophota bacterium]MCM8798948.1 hypothetical protein [Candidatus Omnitrophota bacterium]
MIRKGYILIETLISVVILSVGLTLVMNALGSEIHALRISKNYTHASILLEEKLAEIEKEGGIDLINRWKEGENTGDFKDEYANFHWKIFIQRLQDKKGKSTNLMEVTVTIWWDELGIKRELFTTLYLPIISQ